MLMFHCSASFATQMCAPMRCVCYAYGESLNVIFYVYNMPTTAAAQIRRTRKKLEFLGRVQKRDAEKMCTSEWDGRVLTYKGNTHTQAKCGMNWSKRNEKKTLYAMCVSKAWANGTTLLVSIWVKQSENVAHCQCSRGGCCSLGAHDCVRVAFACFTLHSFYFLFLASVPNVMQSTAIGILFISSIHYLVWKRERASQVCLLLMHSLWMPYHCIASNGVFGQCTLDDAAEKECWRRREEEIFGKM